MPSSFIRKTLALLIGILAMWVPSLILFGVIAIEPFIALPHLLTLSAVGLAISGALYTPRKWWQSALIWALVGTSSLIGLWIGIYAILILLKPWNL